MNGKQLLITGGTGGLGMGVTEVALQQGDSAVVPYLKDSDRERLLKNLDPDLQKRLHLVKADLMDEAR
jgi:NAD(P)-dependent dehydrogenase (short-subunit alcohol dehydrogenase family)